MKTYEYRITDDPDDARNQLSDCGARLLRRLWCRAAIGAAALLAYAVVTLLYSTYLEVFLPLVGLWVMTSLFSNIPTYRIYRSFSDLSYFEGYGDVALLDYVNRRASLQTGVGSAIRGSYDRDDLTAKVLEAIPVCRAKCTRMLRIGLIVAIAAFLVILATADSYYDLLNSDVASVAWLSGLFLFTLVMLMLGGLLCAAVAAQMRNAYTKLNKRVEAEELAVQDLFEMYQKYLVTGQLI